MANGIDPVFGVSLRDLMSDDGVVFNYGNEFNENDERFKFDPNINFTDDELLRFMNLEISDDEDNDDDQKSGDDDDKHKTPVSPGLNFDKIKNKMENLDKEVSPPKGIGEIIPADSQVTIKYSGYLEGQDNPFDSTYQRHSVNRCRLNQGELIWGLDLSVQSMRKHEVSIFLIDPSLAYGEMGCWPTIPGNSEVMFIVHLLDYTDNIAADDYKALEPEERRMFAKIEKSIKQLLVTGADNYKRGQTKLAIRDYKRAIDRLEDTKLDNDQEEERYNSLLSRAYQNLALCYNKEDMPRKACIACNNVINKTAKTYFHYGRALIKMGEYEEALEKLYIALEINSHNEEIMKELELADRLNQKSIEIQEAMRSNCLSMKNLASDSKDEEYKKLATKFCDDFINNNDIMRQPLPDRIDPLLKDTIRKIALLMGIKVSSVNKDKKTSLYLEKSHYQ